MRRARTPRAFAGVFGIAILGLSATGIAFLSAWLVHEITRTRDAETETQLRLLLRTESDAYVRGQPGFELPSVLKGSGYAIVRTAEQAADSSTVTFTATRGPHHHLSNTLTYYGTGARARLTP